MIHFLFGRPGTSKTSCIVEEIRACIRRGDAPVYLIVPEQQAYSAERDVLSALPSDAGRRFSILSFSRLCDTVADRFGGRAQHSISRAMKSLLMWENLRVVNGRLETYGHGGATDPSLCKKMLAATEELTVNAISPDSLESAADKLDHSAPLYGKLRDLALVSAYYTGLLSEVYGENPADRLLRAADQIEKHGFFENAVVFVDSFTSFTMQEYAVLRPMLMQSREVTVTFDCAGRYDPQPQFESMKDAVRRLTRLCEDVGADYADETVEPVASPNLTEIAALESHLWNFGYLPKEDDLPAAEHRGEVSAVVCPTPYDEAQAAALHILELVQSGIPYAEIAVTVRDTSEWEGILDAALDQYGIPYFLSKRTDVSEKPAARLLLTALRCISRRYQREDVLALCKTGLLGLPLREIDYFAEYVDTWRLSGRRMTEEGWSMNPDGYTVGMSDRALAILQAANRVRETVMTPLLSLESKLKAAGTVTEQCRALYEYLCDLDVRNQLSLQAEEYLSAGLVREAGEQVRLWSFLTETLATVASVMESAEVLTPEELVTALSLVFADTDIGSVPARHDCVTVGSASTLRVDNVSAMLVLGLCEGEFPRSVKDDGLLTEQDKETLSELGIELSDRADRLHSDELLYVWRAFSKPTKRLLLSHSAATPEGQSRAPSAALSRMKYLLPYLQVTPFSSDMVADGSSPRFRTPVEDRVTRPTARRLLGEEIWLSQSRLQTYSRCPYSYYGSHILKLREKTEAKFDNLGAGNFLHHVMEQYLRLALDDHNRLRPMTDAEVTETADAVISAYMEELCGDISDNGRLLHLFDRLRQIALMLIHSIQEELATGKFTVAGMEWDTHGRKPGDPRPMTLDLNVSDEDFALLPTKGEGRGLFAEASNVGENGFALLPTKSDAEASAVKLLLGGRIDRVDLYRAADGETVYIRVVDYKSSKHDFTPKSITEDMNIQLLLYLFTLCSPENRSLFANSQGGIPKQVLPASAVYMSPDESDRGGALLPCRTGIVLGDPEIIEAVNGNSDKVFLPSVRRNKSGELTGKGLYSGDRIRELETLLHTAIRDTAAAMYSGGAGRTPSDAACQYCPMKGSCGVCAGN